jgi:predicted transglutaminase-like cysteine proteinase
VTLKSVLAAMILGFLGAAVPLAADAAPNMATGAAAVAPRGFIGFCFKYRAECQATASQAVAVAMTEDRQHELEYVQDKINRLVRPRANPEHVWDYPDDGYGDCNKYALAKRRELIALGWPRAALMLAAALTETGEGHLVLIVATSQGDVVLDNRQRHVVDWRELPYHWLSRQSQTDASVWVSVLPAPPVVTASVR